MRNGYFITLGFFAAALVCYVLGAHIGAIIFSSLAVAVESLFWLRVLTHDDPMGELR